MTSVSIINSVQKEIFISQDFYEDNLFRTEGYIYFIRLLLVKLIPNRRKYIFHKTSVSIINSEEKEIFISQDFCQYN